MSRRPRRGSKRSGGKSVVTALWVAAALVSVAVAGAAAWWSFSSAPAALDAALCPEGGPTGAVLAVIDLTDAVSSGLSTQIRATIRDAVDRAPTGAAVALSAVRPVGQPADGGFARCKPRDGSLASQINENPRMIRERYDETFAAPLDAALAALVEVGAADSSPIMEAIQAAIASAPSWSSVRGPRTLIVASDLLQHSDAFTLYGGGDWSEFQASPQSRRLARNLEGVDVVLLRIPRPSASRVDPERVDDFWVNYFDVQGARSVRVVPMGDL